MIKDLLWFTKNSWKYMQGQRVYFYLFFIPSFIKFYRLGGTRHD